MTPQDKALAALLGATSDLLNRNYAFERAKEMLKVKRELIESAQPPNSTLNLQPGTAVAVFEVTWAYGKNTSRLADYELGLYLSPEAANEAIERLRLANKDQEVETWTKEKRLFT